MEGKRYTGKRTVAVQEVKRCYQNIIIGMMVICLVLAGLLFAVGYLYCETQMQLSTLQAKTQEISAPIYAKAEPAQDEIVAELIAFNPEPTEWWTEEELDLLSRVVMAEAGGTGNDEVMQGVAAVVINRVNHDEFPDTIWDVVFQDGQYACASYLANVEPTDIAIENTLTALRGETDFPADVVWQSSVAQTAYGCEVSVYKEFDTTPYRTVFCHYGD